MLDRQLYSMSPAPYLRALQGSQPAAYRGLMVTQCTNQVSALQPHVGHYLPKELSIPLSCQIEAYRGNRYFVLETTIFKILRRSEIRRALANRFPIFEYSANPKS